MMMAWLTMFIIKIHRLSNKASIFGCDDDGSEEFLWAQLIDIHKHTHRMTICNYSQKHFQSEMKSKTMDK